MIGLSLWMSVTQASGPVVELSGIIESDEPGPIRIELLRPQAAGQNPLLVWHGWVEGPGPYSIDIPAGLDEVKLRAAADIKRDGIGPDDPQIRLPVPLVVGDSNVEGVDLKIRPPEHRAPALPSIGGPPKTSPPRP